jgi:hypothetical protein
MGGLRQRVQRGEPAAQPDCGLDVARTLGGRCLLVQALGDSVAEIVARVLDPVVVEARQEVADTPVQCRLGLAPREQTPDLSEVGPHLRVECDVLKADCQDVGGGVAQSLAQLRESITEARPRAVLAEVRPDAPGDLTTAHRAPLDGEETEQQARIATGWELGLGARDFEAQPIEHVEPDHGGQNQRVAGRP